MRRQKFISIVKSKSFVKDVYRERTGMVSKRFNIIRLDMEDEGASRGSAVTAFGSRKEKPTTGRMKSFLHLNGEPLMLCEPLSKGFLPLGR